MAKLTVQRALDGHTDYIHALQDGTVRFCRPTTTPENDARTENWCRSKVKIKMSEHNLEKYWARFYCRMTGWLVCGPKPSPSGIYDCWSACTTEFPFHKNLYVAGDHNGLMQFNLNGLNDELKAEPAISDCSILTDVAEQTPTEIISIGGTNNYLYICTKL